MASAEKGSTFKKTKTTNHKRRLTMLTSIDMANITKRESQQVLSISDPEYVKLVSQISNLWDEARNTAIMAVNTSLLMANWHTDGICPCRY